MAITKNKKEEIIKSFQKGEGDTGSSEVQVAILTNEINSLTGHLSVNPKDYQTQRGLLLKVGKRKKLLKYLQKKDKESHRRVTSQLALRG